MSKDKVAVVYEVKGGMVTSQYALAEAGSGPFMPDDIQFYTVDWDNIENMLPEEIEDEILGLTDLPDCVETQSLLKEMGEARDAAEKLVADGQKWEAEQKQARIEEARALLAEVDATFDDPADAQRKGL